MPFTIVSAPHVSRPIPEAGGEFGLSFELAAVGGEAHVLVTYDIRPGQPFVFVPPSSPVPTTRIGPEPRRVSVAGQDIARRLTVAKSPAGPPRFVQLFIDIELAEVDAAGRPLILPGGIAILPRQLIAVLTLI